MSFKCRNCNRVEFRPYQVVLETRSVTYPERVYIKRKQEYVDKGGVGFEAVKEARYCSHCYQEHYEKLAKVAESQADLTKELEIRYGKLR